MQHFLTILTTSLLAFTGVLMVFIILLQRGRGGGLAGAFGAMGGQSAFGTKAGDVFTRITIGIALVWVVLAAASGYAMRAESKGRFKEDAVVEKEKVVDKVDGIKPNPIGEPKPAPLAADKKPDTKVETGQNAKPSSEKEKSVPSPLPTAAPKKQTPANPADSPGPKK